MNEYRITNAVWRFDFDIGFDDLQFFARRRNVSSAKTVISARFIAQSLLYAKPAKENDLPHLSFVVLQPCGHLQ